MTKLVLLACICVRLMAVPQWFEPNQGQAHASVQFLSRDVRLTSNKAAIPVEGEKPLVMELIGVYKDVRAEGLDPQSGITNYFLGNDPKKWHPGVPHFARVRYRNIYPGIDVIYYHNAEGRLEYDFIIQPGANASAIRLAYNQPVHIDPNGDLRVAGLRQKRPKVFQDGHEIASDYIVHGKTQVQIALAAYDHSQPLTVDPVLQYSTYLGGPAYDVANAIRADSNGNIYIAGTTRTPAGTGLNPFQQTSGTSQVAIVLKMTPSANAIVWYAVIGGTGGDDAYALAVDSAGSAYLTGQTSSIDFPTINAVQGTYGGGFQDAFAAKLSTDGTKLIYATYLGGSSNETGWGIAVDSSGSACVVGTTASHDFPLHAPLFPQYSVPSAFVAKISPSGKDFIYSTFLGGTDGQTRGQSVAIDSIGAAYVTGWTSADDFPIRNGIQNMRRGQNAFVSKFAPDGGSILYSTFLGGSQFDYGYSITLDTTGNIYVAGQTGSPDFPLKNALQTSFGGGYSDVFLVELNAAGDKLLYATYIGGSGADFPGQVVVDGAGHLYLSGWTGSADFPQQASLQGYGGGLYDAFVLELTPATNNLIFSTYLGGGGDDRAFGLSVDSTGTIAVAGVTTSADFPVKNAFQPTYGGGFGDMFVAGITSTSVTSPSIAASPSVLPLTFVIGGAVPSAQSISVTSSPSGQSFSATADASWIALSSSSATTPGTITVSVNPAGLKAGPYVGTIRVGPQTAVQVNFTVLNPPPFVTSVSPSTIPPGSDDTTITLTGSGFVNGAVVQFSVGSNSLPTTFVDSGTLQVVIYKGLAEAAATYTLVVVNPQSAPSQPFQVVIGTRVPMFTAASVVNAASFAGGPVAPGEIVSIFGTNLTGNVTFDRAPATLVFSSPNQVNVTVPYSVSGTTVLQMGASSVQLPVASSAPGIFAAASAGDGIIVLYATGCGSLTTDALPLCALPVLVTVNGEPAQVLYAGIAPGLVQGANQINFKLPSDITTGQVSIILTAGDGSSKPFSFTLP
jgi:uncharacterized protein (TIGR03437 family)